MRDEIDEFDHTDGHKSTTRPRDATHLAQCADELDSDSTPEVAVSENDTSDEISPPPINGRAGGYVCAGGYGGGGKGSLPPERKGPVDIDYNRMFDIPKWLSSVLGRKGDSEVQRDGYIPMRPTPNHREMRDYGATNLDLAAIIGVVGGNSELRFDL